MSTNKVTITLHTDGEITVNSLANAVRRLTSANVTIPAEGSVEAKGLTVEVRAVKGVPFKSKQDVRTWAAANGFPEVVGKRGRIRADILQAYAAAN